MVKEQLAALDRAATQPTEADIRAACEEAGVPRISLIGYCEGDYLPNAILALARRIAAEREAVVVARATAAEAENARLREALTRQADNMDFVLNHFDVFGQWYFKFRTELEEDRAALQENQNVG